MSSPTNRRRTAFSLLLATAFVSPIARAQTVWIGPEIPVNVVTAGSQFAPAIAADAEGHFVVAWQGDDGSGFGVRARRFAADGTPASGEIAVNSTTAGDQISPAVAALPGGAFVVAWASSGQDGSGFGIVARRFGATGAPLGGETAVNVTTAGGQTAPRVVADATGGFVVIWTGQGPGDSNEVYARAFGASGAAAGGEFRVNSTVSGHQIQPAIARLAGGAFAAAWASEGQDGSGYAVVARIFTAAGAFVTGEIPVPEVTVLDQTQPAVAAIASGFVVAWQRSLQASPQPVGPQPIVAFRRFDFAGSALGVEKPVNLDTAVRHEKPALAADADGGFTVAWRETNLATEDKNAIGARYDAAGLSDGGSFALNTTLPEDQIDPVLASSALPGRLVGAWSSFAQDGSSFGVFAQRFGRVGAPCSADDETLCLDGNRFRVRATFATAAGASGAAQAEALTDESGYFTFFDPANVEIVVKSIDACGLAGFQNFWIFATGLTNVQVTMTVEDTASGDARVYTNALDHDFAPILDTSHFQVCGAAREEAALPASSTSPTSAHPAMSPAGAVAMEGAAATGSCVADAETLCLRDGRFEVKIDWSTAIPSSGHGQAVPLTDESGYFWFFDDANVELVIKVIDGCGYNDRFWVFAGGLTDVATHLVVRDTAHPGATFERVKALGVPFAPILSIEAFGTCP